MIEAFIFDLDGVMIDSKKLHFQAAKKFWARRGVKISWEKFIKNFGRANVNILSEYYKGLSKKELKNLSNEIESNFQAIARKKLKAGKGAGQLLRLLKKNGIKVALASNAPNENVEIFFKRSGLRKFFNVVVSGDDVKYPKPHPEVFLKSAKKLDVRRTNCVVVEDSQTGITAAKRAGMICIALTTTLPESRLKEADIIAKDMSKINLGNK